MLREIKSNRAELAGRIVTKFSYSHEVFGEKFYTANLEIRRFSEKTDIIPLMISERLFNVSEDYVGRAVRVSGQIRSYNRHEGNRSRLIISVFVQEIELVEEPVDCTKSNHIFLDGFICKAPVYRKTILGREITDILLAVDRPYGKKDYIPCIAWGRNAEYASNMNVGDHLQAEGRIQSREYQKRISETETETRVAYEVSLSKMELVQ